MALIFPQILPRSSNMWERGAPMVLLCHRRVSVLIRRGFVPDHPDQCVPVSPGLDHGRGARRSVVDHCPLWSDLSIFFVGTGGGGRPPLTSVGVRHGGSWKSVKVKIDREDRAARASDFRTADRPGAAAVRLGSAPAFAVWAPVPVSVALTPSADSWGSAD